MRYQITSYETSYGNTDDLEEAKRIALRAEAASGDLVDIVDHTIDECVGTAAYGLISMAWAGGPWSRRFG